MTGQTIASELTGRVDAELRDIVNSRTMPLYKMMSYHMGWDDEREGPHVLVGRPRTHGVLCLLACRAVGGDPDVALPAAAAVELVYSFCEIHDDVQGGKPRRDDRDAVWWLWGPAQAINAGDGMHALARLALFRLVERGVSQARTWEAVQALDEASLETCEGRFLDLEAQERIDTRVDSYMEMAAKKSGALASCAMKLGTLVVSEDVEARAAMSECGARIGLAIQVRDDLEELWGTGPAGAGPSPDVMNKKKLLPAVYALENASRTEKRKLGEVYFKRVLEPEDVETLRQVLEEIGGKSYCEQFVERQHAEGMAVLKVDGIASDARADIEEYVDSLLS